MHIDNNEVINYYILTREEMIKTVEYTDDLYYNRLRIRSLNDCPIEVYLKDLIQYKDKWENLWK